MNRGTIGGPTEPHGVSYMNNNVVDKGGMPQKDFLPRMGAGCLVVLGAIMLMAAVGSLVDKSSDAVAGFIICLIMSAALIAGAVFWFRYIRAHDQQRIDLYQEKMILGLAAKHGGYLTLAMVVLESSCTATQAEMAMEQMIRQGFAQPELMDDGTVRYRFGGLIDGGRGGS